METSYLLNSLEHARLDPRVVAIYRRNNRDGFVSVVFAHGDDRLTIDEYDLAGSYFVRFRDNEGQVRTCALGAF